MLANCKDCSLIIPIGKGYFLGVTCNNGVIWGLWFVMCIFMRYFIYKMSILGVYLLCVSMKFQFFSKLSLSKHNRTRYQENTHTQRHMNIAWSEMVPCLAFYSTFPSWFIQCIWYLNSHFPQPIWIYLNLIHYWVEAWLSGPIPVPGGCTVH